MLPVIKCTLTQAASHSQRHLTTAPSHANSILAAEPSGLQMGKWCSMRAEQTRFLIQRRQQSCSVVQAGGEKSMLRQSVNATEAKGFSLQTVWAHV